MSKESTDLILHRIMKLHPKIIDLKLDRVQNLLKKLGNPEKKLPPIIHIAGTNGKGSTQAIIKSGLEADGKIVHAYTSPHLLRFNDRINLAGEAISEHHLNEILEECCQLNDGLPITYFEITTVAAILAFSKVKADYCILEVGLGGRYDATNIIDRPELCIITPISLDHQKLLGETIEEIAFEKAGILKNKSVCFVGKQEPKALKVIKNVANQTNSMLRVYNEDWVVKENIKNFYFKDNKGSFSLPLPALVGSHQVYNAGIAVAALRYLGVSSSSVLKNSMRNVVWPGRMQRIVSGPLTKITNNLEIWLDGGHNAAAGQALAEVLKLLPPMRTILICGMLNTKDAFGYMINFKGIVAEVIAIPVPNEVATLTAEETSNYAIKAGLKSSHAQNIEDALNRAVSDQTPSRIVICGSLYLAGFILRKFT